MRRRRVGYGLAGVALCLGGVLAAGGGDGQGDGYAAVGAAGGEGRPEGVVPPSGKVVLVPLDGAAPGTGTGATTGPSTSTDAGSNASGGAGTDTSTGAGAGAGTPAAPGASPAPPGTPGTPGTQAPVPPTPGGSEPAPPAPAPPTATPPPGPAVLVVAEVRRAPADKRWCENVTVEFRNTGGSSVRSGTVAFGTHIIGALGIDWATIDSAQPLPVPIAAGAARTTTYTVCVDSWRVPLGMRIETQDVRAEHPS
ncbi:hypothetical protein [Streptomyces sp. NPDC055709]